MIFHVTERGFCAVFQRTGEPPLVLIGEGAPERFLDVMLSGNVFHIPSSYLTDARAACEAALRYLNSGSLDPEQPWEPFNAVQDGDDVSH